MPPDVSTVRPSRRVRKKPKWFVRLGLLAVLAGLVAVFTIAALIRPYDADGQPARMGSHQQIGLPPCEFLVRFKKPCPACGMTTSFSLLMHGDFWNSFQANSIGTIFALALMGVAILLAVSLVRGRYRWLRQAERWGLAGAGSFLVLMMIRWVVVVWL